MLFKRFFKLYFFVIFFFKTYPFFSLGKEKLASVPAAGPAAAPAAAAAAPAASKEEKKGSIIFCFFLLNFRLDDFLIFRRKEEGGKKGRIRGRRYGFRFIRLILRIRQKILPALCRFLWKKRKNVLFLLLN